MENTNKTAFPATFASTAISLLLILMTSFSCSSNNKQQPETEPVEIIEEPEEPKEPPFLPDTSYASVENLDFSITIFDSITPESIEFSEDQYTNTPGIFTFRGDMLRSAGFSALVDSIPTDIEIEWAFETDYDHTPTSYGTWGGGNGWTGQPLYVEWPDSVYEKFQQTSPALTKDFGKRELIISSLCGTTYFVNFENGKISRNPIEVGNPIKGTAMLDPSL
ncbi:MAG: hypothetical protein HUK15_06750, partial [Bacteroidales bacterium]|nr:hypothetical protein [Bacteroidales bacterium]